MAMTPKRISNIKKEISKKVAKWINTPTLTDQGFYPLHYASNNGKVKLIKLLVKHGADI